MSLIKKSFFRWYILLILLIFLILFFYLTIKNFQKEKFIIAEPISINLLTSVHPNLSWNFKPVKPEISIKPGDVTIVEYVVENLVKKESTGIATFAYFPREFGKYIKKINCFCYDAQTLKSNEKVKFTLVLLMDPEVTKDSKTKNVKDITIQFTFFDYKDYKKTEN